MAGVREGGLVIAAQYAMAGGSWDQGGRLGRSYHQNVEDTAAAAV